MKKLFSLLLVVGFSVSACRSNNFQNEENGNVINNGGESNGAQNDEAQDADDLNDVVDSMPRNEVLAGVESWIYFIGIDLDEDTVDEIVASDYDMVVIDFIISEAENTDYPLEAVIAQFQEAEHPKLVIAYIDVGQAESYRTYWQQGWEIGNPSWIISGDPDGWEDNYPVAYWYDEYQAIWLGEQGYLQTILDVGFDGIYLDWVEAYSDVAVAAFADAEGVDPVEEMVWWVGDMADYVRERDSEFIVISQNAAELAAYDDFVEIVDAIAQEQVWFDGGADNDPPGDCPLPASEDDIESDAYVDSLSRVCKRQHDAFPESTLHVSSDWYVEDLQVAQRKGLVIFTVDYALDAANIAWVYEASRSLGFIPFVSNRQLDQFIEVYP